MDRAISHHLASTPGPASSGRHRNLERQIKRVCTIPPTSLPDVLPPYPACHGFFSDAAVQTVSSAILLGLQIQYFLHLFIVLHTRLHPKGVVSQDVDHVRPSSKPGYVSTWRCACNPQQFQFFVISSLHLEWKVFISSNAFRSKARMSLVKMWVRLVHVKFDLGPWY